MQNETLKDCCVVNSSGLYRAFVTVHTKHGADGKPKEKVLGYTLSAGERLIDAAPPAKRLHAGSAGFVKPRWDENDETWVEGATADELAAWESEHPAPAVDLDTLRAAKQEVNKKFLADWLSSHPMTWTDGNVYGVTEQDQNEMAYNLTKFQFQPPNQEPTLLEWHAQKKERHTFTLDEYKDLFFAIDSYVEPYRRYQESVKQAIYKAETAQEIESIQIDYSSVVSNEE